MTEPKGITHISGRMDDLVQQCTRCLVILCDYRNTMVVEGSKPRVGGFEEGAYVTIYPGFPTTTVVGEHADAEHCVEFNIDL